MWKQSRPTFQKVLKIRFEKRIKPSPSAKLKQPVILGTAQEVQKTTATL